MNILFVFSATPHAGARAQEGLDALLMGSAFAECSAMFTGDAVWQLLPDQSPETIGHKNFTLGFAALKEYGVSNILCCSASLEAAGLTADQLSIGVTVATPDEIRAALNDADRVLGF